MARVRGTVVMPAGTPADPDPETIDPGLLENDEAEGDPLGDLVFLTDAADDVSWGVERYKSADEIRINPRGRNRVFVTTIDGAVNLVAFQREHGGGVFRFYGKRGDGTMYGSKKVELAGARRSYTDTTTAANGPTPPADRDSFERRALRVMLKKIRALEQRAMQPVTVAAPAAPPPAAPPMTIDTIFALADRISQRREPTQDPVDRVTDALLRGIDIGTAREPQPPGGGNDTIAIVKELAPVLKELLSGIGTVARARAAQRPGPRPGTGTPPAPPAAVPDAEVVDSAPISAPVAIDYRFMAVVDALDRAIQSGTEPDDFASTMADTLQPPELFWVKTQPVDTVMAKLLDIADDQLPVLKTPEARAYVDQVVTALKAPPAAE